MITKPTFFRFTTILVAIAVFMQLIIILYNHFSGFLVLDGFNDFMMRWIFGSLLSIVILPFFTKADLYLVARLNHRLPWRSQWRMRIFVELLSTFLIAAIGSMAITLVSNAISGYEHALGSILIFNVIIGSIINLIIVIFFEAWNWYWAKEQSESEKQKLESELKAMRFELLKQQINPHFMFNSLNVLSGLVRKNADLAEEFISAFADVYRYVMESIEKPMVGLSEELKFARSYFFLQQIRHGDGIDWKVDLPIELMNHQLPPLSLQLLLENAIKHNAFSSKNPICIEISAKDEYLMVSNPIQKQSQITRSSGTGLQNLKNRYSFIHDKLPTFTVSEQRYIARLPLLKPTA
jgi:two-component system LytT family sensor kinase